MPPLKIDLAMAKVEVTRGLAPGHPGREALLALPDELEATAFDAIFPSILRLLRLRPVES